MTEEKGINDKEASEATDTLESGRVLVAGERGIDLSALQFLFNTTPLHHTRQVATAAGQSVGAGRQPGKDLPAFDIIADIALVASAPSLETGTYLLLFYADPVCEIADALEAGDDPDAAVDAWLSRISEVLGVYRKYRRESAIMNLQAALSAPSKMVEWLNERWGLQLVLPASEPKSMDSPASPLYAVIADYHLRHHIDAQAVAAELDASSPPIGAPHAHDVRAILEQFRLSIPALAEEVREVREKNRFLEQQIQAMFQSKSWKITAPIRWILDVLKGR